MNLSKESLISIIKNQERLLENAEYCVHTKDVIIAKQEDLIAEMGQEILRLTPRHCKDCGVLLDEDVKEFGQCDACFMIEDFARYLELQEEEYKMNNKQMQCKQEDYNDPRFQEGNEWCCIGCDYMQWSHDDGCGICTAYQTQHKEETIQDLTEEDDEWVQKIGPNYCRSMGYDCPNNYEYTEACLTCGSDDLPF